MMNEDDAQINCILDYNESKIELKEYSNFKNFEPTSIYNYFFHYTIDSEGNVDDIILDNADKIFNTSKNFSNIIFRVFI